MSGGSSIDGEWGIIGEVEKIEPVSDMSDGAPSAESARETSEMADGDGSGVSMFLLKAGTTLVR